MGVRHACFVRAFLAAVILPGGVASADVVVTEHTADAGVAITHDPQPSPSYPLGIGWMTGGAAAADFDRDGFIDLYVTSGGTGPDHLFINDGDGTFTDASEDWGLDAVHCGNGVAVGDVDRNGWLDVFVTSYGTPPDPAAPGQNRLYLNMGGWFEEAAAELGVETSCTETTTAMGAAFGDYDLDGRLDLFVAAWNTGGEGNVLFRQTAGGVFEDVTADAIGPAALEGVWGFQPAFADMDGDRWPELLLSADFESSRYLRNDADGSFTDVTAASGTGLDENGMGQTVGDFDNDGLLDWYVTSIHYANPPPTHYNGNTLYRAVGPHEYEEVAAERGADDGGWGWGTVAVDLDQDGWLDLVEVNGREGNGQWHGERAKLYHNQGDGSFVEMAETAGLDHALSGRAIVWLDIENDGDLDFVIITNDGPIELYRNDSSPMGHWLQVRLDASPDPRLAPDGFGARVTVRTGSLEQSRLINSSPSFLGTSPLLAHFGLGPAALVDELRVDWPNGRTTTISGVGGDQRLVLVAPVPADVTADGVVDVDDLLAVLLAWGPCAAAPCAADVNGDGVIDVDDLLEILLAWGSG